LPGTGNISNFMGYTHELFRDVKAGQKILVTSHIGLNVCF